MIYLFSSERVNAHSVGQDQTAQNVQSDPESTQSAFIPRILTKNSFYKLQYLQF